MTYKKANKVEDLKSVYLIYGDEEYLAKEALKRLRGLFEVEAGGDLDTEVMDAREAGARKIIDSAEISPMISDRRLMIVYGVDKLSKSEKDKIINYIGEPNPKTVLVMVTTFPEAGESRDAGKVKRIESSAIYKKVKQEGEALKFARPGKGRQKSVEDWVRKEFKKKGKKVTEGAATLLVQRAGTDFRDLANVIERVCLYAGEETTVTDEIVEETVFQSAFHGVFELVDSVAERRRDVSLLLLNRLISQGENPQNLFNLLVRQFRIIARVKALSHSYGRPEIASIVGVPPFLVSKCEMQARKYSTGKLREIFIEFKNAQMEMHSAKYLPGAEYQSLIMEKLIVGIIG
ncbi:MAG: DNA polymerase III subunit delta [Actinobacteria bacterium]|nr:DNA polymerase III subunit delta [Actinomycetota bacterium]